MFLKNNTIIFKFEVIFSFINQIVLKFIRNLNQLFCENMYKRMSILKLFFYRNMDVKIHKFKKKKFVRIYLKNNFKKKIERTSFLKVNFYGTKFGMILNKHLGK